METLLNVKLYQLCICIFLALVVSLASLLVGSPVFITLYNNPAGFLGSLLSPTATNVSEREKFGIIIDAGSSGSRIHIFKWNNKDILNSISEISRLKITPGISHYITYDEPGVAAGESLHELLKHAEKSIPKEFHASTTISLKATAGMRLLEREDQIRILHGVRKKLKSSSFLFERARVLGGTSEALFAWITVNVGKKTITNMSVIEDPMYENMEKTYGIIELGGASSQIVQPSNEIFEERHGLRHLKVLYGTQRHPFCLYAVSRLHFGLHRAYDLLLELFLKTAHKSASDDDGDMFPCAFAGDPRVLGDFNNDKRIKVKSNYHQCKKLVKHLVRKMEGEDISKLGGFKRKMLSQIQNINPVSYYALDNFAKLITIMAKSNLRLPNDWDEEANEIVVTDMNKIVENGKRLCNDFNYSSYMNAIGNPKKVKLKRKACFGVVYMDILLRNLYNVLPSEKHPITFAHRIDNEVDAGWTLGAMVSDIYIRKMKLDDDADDWDEADNLVNPLHK